MMIYTTDTHSLIWFLTRNPKLSSNALKAFREADEGSSVIIIPSIVVAELMYIAEYKDLSLKFKDLLSKIEESKNYAVYNLDFEVLIETMNYKKLKDIHDKIIVATAVLNKSKLITSDGDVKKSGYVEVIW